MSPSPDTAQRCGWAESSELMGAYHDHEWGVPSRDDDHLFEMLILEGAQAGLSWSLILSRREHYRRALDGFAFERIASYDDAKLAALLQDPGIVRNRLKLRATIGNAKAFMATREEFGTFSNYLWAWVEDSPVINEPLELAEVPATSELSGRLSKDLKRRGFRFVGSTIVYSYLEAVGCINDHIVGCPAKYQSR